MNSKPRLQEKSNDCNRPTIALLPWGNALEEFLDTIGISLDTFCGEFTGSWMFGYIEALQRVGVRTVLICISGRIDTPAHFTHAPTGATICLLPAPWLYRAIRRRMINPYGRNVKQAFGQLHGPGRLLLPLLAVLREVVLYFTTPLGLLARELRTHACKAILCQEYEYPRFDVCVLLGKLMHLPVFATFQGGDYQRSRIERYIRPLTLRACAGLIIGAQSEIDRVRTYYGVPTVRMARIFNPLDVALWSPLNRNDARAALGIPSAARVVVWHGRVSISQKGLDTLLDAWETICRENSGQDFMLLLVGTGRDKDQLRRRLSAIDPKNILWLDNFVNDRTTIRQCLSAADIYAFPSRHEGFPVSPIEAMSCGLPLVATDAHGVPDILETQESSGGLIVPRDNPAEFAGALTRLLYDPSTCRELGNRARRRAEISFSLETVGQQLRTFLFNGQSDRLPSVRPPAPDTLSYSCTDP